MTYTLNAADGAVTFTPSPSGKTVVVAVVRAERGGDGDIVTGVVKQRRMRVDKARALYKSLIQKRYKKA